MSRQNIRPALPSIGLRLACNEIPAENESARLLFGLAGVTIDCLEDGSFLGNTPEIVVKNSLADNIQSHLLYKHAPPYPQLVLLSPANNKKNMRAISDYSDHPIRTFICGTPLQKRVIELTIQRNYREAHFPQPSSAKVRTKTVSFPPYSSNNSAMNIKLASPETHLTVDCWDFFCDRRDFLSKWDLVPWPWWAFKISANKALQYCVTGTSRRTCFAMTGSLTTRNALGLNARGKIGLQKIKFCHKFGCRPLFPLIQRLSFVSWRANSFATSKSNAPTGFGHSLDNNLDLDARNSAVSPSSCHLAYVNRRKSDTAFLLPTSQSNRKICSSPCCRSLASYDDASSLDAQLLIKDWIAFQLLQVVLYHGLLQKIFVSRKSCLLTRSQSADRNGIRRSSFSLYVHIPQLSCRFTQNIPRGDEATRIQVA